MVTGIERVDDLLRQNAVFFWLAKDAPKCIAQYYSGTGGLRLVWVGFAPKGLDGHLNVEGTFCDVFNIISTETSSFTLWWICAKELTKEEKLEKFLQESFGLEIPESIFVAVEGGDMFYTLFGPSATFFFDSRRGKTEDLLEVWKRTSGQWERTHLQGLEK